MHQYFQCCAFGVGWRLTKGGLIKLGNSLFFTIQINVDDFPIISFPFFLIWFIESFLTQIFLILGGLLLFLGFSTHTFLTCLYVSLCLKFPCVPCLSFSWFGGLKWPILWQWWHMVIELGMIPSWWFFECINIKSDNCNVTNNISV